MQQSDTELNLLWGQLILEELARLGVQHICMAPGSRSTPLTLAASSANAATCHTHFDERGLGFFALGLAKASHSPVAIITTSGTAVANLYPAIVEAHLTQVPLIILSGDRPPELIDCGANQAINQMGIFAHYAKQVNLPTPSKDFPASGLLTTLDQACCQLNEPIHINCMFREPFYPSDVKPLTQQFKQANVELAQYLKPIVRWQQTTKPYTQYQIKQHSVLPAIDALKRFAHGKGVIVVGSLLPSDNPQLIIELGQTLGWPLVVDGQSQLRQHPSVLGHADQLLLNNKTAKLLKQADKVLVFGGRFISKRLMAFLGEQQWQSYWHILPKNTRLDPNHISKEIWLCGVSDFCAMSWPRSSSANWALPLYQHNEDVETLLKREIDNAAFGEAQVIRWLAKQAKSLFVGNSLPIRLYDMYAPISAGFKPVYTNRGASGIDGLIATSAGVAIATQQPLVMIVGDISCLHDLNSLALLKQITTPYVLVIINNDGGNIFNLLPVPNEQLRQDFYRLPHGLEFGYACGMFGLAYRQVDDLTSFIEFYNEAIAFNCASVIEVNVSQTQASEQIAQISHWMKQV